MMMAGAERKEALGAGWSLRTSPLLTHRQGKNRQETLFW
jgi:hypothetical protein